MDYNNDGILDIVVGERYDDFNFFTGNGDGTVSFSQHPWDDAGDPIVRNYNTSPYLTDWNEDGYIDFTAGGHDLQTTTGGILEVYLNTGDDPDSPVWSASTIDLTPLCNMWRLTQETFDLDGDGDKDLVLGYEMGNVWFAENIGTNDDPQFSGYVQLTCDAGDINVYSTFSGGGRAREHVTDLNDDGIPDLLVGCSNGWVYYFEGYTDTGIGGGDAAVTGDFGIHVSGTPTTGPFSLNVTMPLPGDVTIQVIDMAGRVMFSRTETMGSGRGTVPMNVSGLPAGFYMVRARSGDEVSCHKLTVIN